MDGWKCEVCGGGKIFTPRQRPGADKLDIMWVCIDCAPDFDKLHPEASGG